MVAYGVSLPAMARVKWSTARVIGVKRFVARSAVGICPRGWDALEALVNGPYGARYMQLESEGEEMPFHTDAMRETWCLHIPLVTIPDALFQWQFPDG